MKGYDTSKTTTLYEFDCAKEGLIFQYDRLVVRIQQHLEDEPKIWIGREANVTARSRKIGRYTESEAFRVAQVLLKAVKWIREYKRGVKT
jgi:hypothetical protein